MMWGGVEARALVRSSPIEIVAGSTCPSQLVVEVGEEVAEVSAVEEEEGHLGQVGQSAVDECP